MHWIEEAIRNGQLIPTAEGLAEIKRRRSWAWKFARAQVAVLDAVDRGRAIVAFMFAAAAALIFPAGKCGPCDHALLHGFASSADHVPRWLLTAAARLSALLKAAP